MQKLPSLRSSLDLLFVFACILLAADVLAPEIFGQNGKSKDYPLWYWAGQQVLQGTGLYPANPDTTIFPYIYPPFPAVLLAAPSYFGKIFLYSFLVLINVAAWWFALQFSNTMAGSKNVPDRWIAALPAALTAIFVFDNFDLGQPNLLLLTVMLFGFWLMERKCGWAAGAMFAFATAIKVFPITVFPYLLWRRQWFAAASMAAFLGFFLVLAPAPIRGYERNVSELKTWFYGMAGSNSEDGFGQRGEQNWSFVNQSIIAMTHRLTRPVNYNQNDVSAPPRFVNIFNFDYKTSNYILLALSALIGLGFIAVIPPEAKRTRLTNACELGILLCLMTIASPLAREYYFVWLIFPVTVLVQRAAYDPRPAVRTGTWTALAIAFLLLALSFPIFSNYLQAIGNNLVATIIIMAGLAWHICNEAAPAYGSTQQS